MTELERSTQAHRLAADDWNTALHGYNYERCMAAGEALDKADAALTTARIIASTPVESRGAEHAAAAEDGP